MSSGRFETVSRDVCFVIDSGERVKIEGLSTALSNSFQPRSSEPVYHINGVVSAKSRKKRVAVLISGSGAFCCLSVTPVIFCSLHFTLSRFVLSFCFGVVKYLIQSVLCV